MTVRNITDFLNAHDIKPSYQRIKIYEYLIHNIGHPTAEMIYRELVKTIPTISRTTIYNSLKIFVEKDIIKIITVDGNEIHYDSVLKEHGHFRCKTCGDLYNFPLEATCYLGQVEGFVVEERNIYLKGICKNCNK